MGSFTEFVEEVLRVALIFSLTGRRRWQDRPGGRHSRLGQRIGSLGGQRGLGLGLHQRLPSRTQGQSASPNIPCYTTDTQQIHKEPTLCQSFRVIPGREISTNDVLLDWGMVLPSFTGFFLFFFSPHRWTCGWCRRPSVVFTTATRCPCWV